MCVVLVCFRSCTFSSATYLCSCVHPTLFTCAAFLKLSRWPKYVFFFLRKQFNCNSLLVRKSSFPPSYGKLDLECSSSLTIYCLQGNLYKVVMLYKLVCLSWDCCIMISVLAVMWVKRTVLKSSLPIYSCTYIKYTLNKLCWKLTHFTLKLHCFYEV